MRSHWGSLDYDRNTKTARIRYWANGPDGYRRRSLTLRNVTKRDAQKKMASLMVEHSDDSPCPTVGQVWEQWVHPELVQRVESGQASKGTLTKYESTYRRHISDRWGDVQCGSVRSIDVQQWLLGGMTRSQANSARKLMSVIMEKAVMYDMVPSNVMKVKYLLPHASTSKSKDKGIWTLEELGLVWERLRGTPIEAPFILSAFGSCRVGESLGVMVDDVSVMGDVTIAEVRRQVDQIGTVSDRLKTSASRRAVVIPGNAGKRLLTIAEGSERWLADNGCGMVIGQRVLNETFSDMVTGELYHPFRNLRNSWETYMRWDLGVPPWCTETLMGHSGGGVTERYYDRPDIRRFAAVVSEAWAAWIGKGNVDPMSGKWDS